MKDFKIQSLTPPARRELRASLIALRPEKPYTEGDLRKIAHTFKRMPDASHKRIDRRSIRDR